MKSLKIICGGIGFLVFSICCILFANMSDMRFLLAPGQITLIIGSIMVIVGLFINDK